jgi:hypothetical protein
MKMITIRKRILIVHGISHLLGALEVYPWRWVVSEERPLFGSRFAGGVPEGTWSFGPRGFRREVE